MTENPIDNPGLFTGDDAPQPEPLPDNVTDIEAFRKGTGGGGRPANTEKTQKKEKLTSKQLGFVAAILEGKNQSDAYRQAYDAENMSDKAIHNSAWKMFKNDEICRRIEKGRGAQEQVALHSAASYRADLTKTLHHILLNGTTEANQIRAGEVLGKLEHVSAFLDRSTDIPADALAEEEVIEQLEDRLKELFKSRA